jgi:hypothetical protein
MTTKSSDGYARDGLQLRPESPAEVIESKHERMNFRDAGELLDTLETDATRVYGQPYQTADGTTIIPVARVRGGALGVFVVKDGTSKWEPAVDATRIAMMGILVGLVSAALAGLAMVRRPPWPDLHGDISSPRR